MPVRSGRIYFVPLGPGASAPVKDLADHFRQSYRLKTSVLPKLSWEPGAALIGVTAQDMYISAFTWNFAFGYREGDRFALLLTARTDPTWFAGPAKRRTGGASCSVPPWASTTSIVSAGLLGPRRDLTQRVTP